MAIVECEECGKEISNSAKNCPNCGAKTLTSKKKSICRQWSYLILVVLLIALVVVYVSVMMPSTIENSNREIKNWLNQNPRIKLLDESCIDVDLEPILPPFKFGGYATFESGAKVFVTLKTNPFTGSGEYEVSQSEMADMAATKVQKAILDF